MTATKPNIIFLDVDGVLCTPRACLAVGNVGGGFSYLDPIACLLVRKLCEECNAKLVISSAWRIDINDWSAFTSVLDAACPNLGRYIWPDQKHWRTCSYIHDDLHTTSDRGREIRKWLEDHEGEYNNFVILDDMADMRPLEAKLVRCNYYNGIGYDEYHLAEGVLMKGYNVE